MGANEDGNDAVSVLAVDDCPATREIMRASLERLGYKVRAVDSGRAALDAVTQARFDVIVLDVQMPDMSGVAVGRALRSTPGTAAAAIAMHSSVPEAEVRADFDAYDLYVRKSMDPRALGDQVEHLVRRLRSANRARSEPSALACPLMVD